MPIRGEGRSRGALGGVSRIDSYEPGTRMEQGYECGISSIYQEDSIEGAASIAANCMKKDIIGGIEVHT